MENNEQQYFWLPLEKLKSYIKLLYYMESPIDRNKCLYKSAV